MRFDQHEEKFTSEGLVVRLSKNLKAFYHFFKTLPLFFRLFPGLENCCAIFKTFSRIQDCTNPAVFNLDTVIQNSTSPKIRLHLTELSEAK